jgi:hypothetical protein
MRVLLGSFLVLLAACRGEQDLRSDCVADGGACPACTTDSDCIIVSNACYATANCTHRRREPPLAVTQIGCNQEYDVPPPERCGCVSSVCRAR